MFEEWKKLEWVHDGVHDGVLDGMHGVKWG